MTPVTVAELLEGYASQVTKLPGVSRTNPHAFAEAKSELAGEIRAEAKRLRTMATPQASVRPVSEVGVGPRTIGRRNVMVDRRARRSGPLRNS